MVLLSHLTFDGWLSNSRDFDLTGNFEYSRKSISLHVQFLKNLIVATYTFFSYFYPGRWVWRKVVAGHEASKTTHSNDIFFRWKCWLFLLVMGILFGSDWRLYSITVENSSKVEHFRACATPAYIGTHSIYRRLLFVTIWAFRKYLYLAKLEFPLRCLMRNKRSII